MRNICTLLLILIATSSNAQLTNGLVGHWNFNGNASDVSGNGLHGTPSNITYTTGKTGLANTAASFNGTSSVITVPYDSKMNPTKLSVCAMVKFNNFYNGPCQHSMILQRGSFFTSGSYSLSIFENAYDGDCNTYDSTKMVFHQKVANCESGITLDSFKHSPNVNKNQWYCVIATYDSSRIKIYVDGVQKISYSSANPFGTSTEGLSIGANMFNQVSLYPYWLNGSIDNLRLYNRTLSQTEIDSFCGLFSSVKDINLDNLTLYPNPNNGNFTVSANSIVYDKVLLEVMNPLGQVILRKQVTVTHQQLNEGITTEQLSSGIYLLRISADGKQRNIRFTVSN